VRNPYLIGQTIYLRPFDPVADSSVVVGWLNDQEVTRYLRRYLPMTLAEEEQFLRTLAGSTRDLGLAMVRREDDQLIGAAGLHDMEMRNRHAQFGIMIGDKSAWGKGHGSEATRLVLGLAFEKLNLNRVWLHVYEYNERAKHVYEKLGFRIEGRLRQDIFYAGRYWNTLVMGFLREEWPGEAAPR
jgi:RimJ/RimL family protein N-acetyltransferase